MNTGFHFFTEFHYWLYGAVLASARLFPAFMLMPFLNHSTVSGLFKFPLIFLLGAALWPQSGAFIQQLSILDYIGLLVKELVTGLIMAMFLCFPYWAIHAVGSFIDNQRGATISSSLSPLTGVDSSELANFFNLMAVVVILEAGGATVFLNVMQNSYLLWPSATWDFPPLLDVLRFIDTMVAQAVRIASPVITMFLATEMLLGLLARYTPQLNAFSIALTVKSAIGFGVLLLYMSPILPAEITNLQHYFLP